jgi:hypothetical protein
MHTIAHRNICTVIDHLSHSTTKHIYVHIDYTTHKSHQQQAALSQSRTFLTLLSSITHTTHPNQTTLQPNPTHHTTQPNPTHHTTQQAISLRCIMGIWSDLADTSRTSRRTLRAFILCKAQSATLSALSVAAFHQVRLTLSPLITSPLHLFSSLSHLSLHAILLSLSCLISSPILISRISLSHPILSSP